MLNRTISVDAEVAELTNELGGLAGLLYTWTIAHLDRDGRITGNPDVLRAQVAPMLSGITPELVRSVLATADRLELIKVYTAEGKTWVVYPKFKRNQQGMRYDREATSTIPPPTDTAPDWLRSDSGGLRLNGMEWNGKEEKGKEATPRPIDPSATVTVGDILAQIQEWPAWPTPTGLTRKAKTIAAELGSVSGQELEDGRQEAEQVGQPNMGLLLSIILRRRKEQTAFDDEVDRLRAIGERRNAAKSR
jgi:hypothetical protein